MRSRGIRPKPASSLLFDLASYAAIFRNSVFSVRHTKTGRCRKDTAPYNPPTLYGYTKRKNVVGLVGSTVTFVPLTLPSVTYVQFVVERLLVCICNRQPS